MASAATAGQGLDADINLSSVAVFSTYKCSSVSRGKPHPGDIAEPASLSAVPLPSTNYPLWEALPEEVVSKGLLSQLQLEGVLHACAKHQQILPSGERCGFMIGDGAGVGKGRQIAAVIMDNFARGRRKHVWVSISTDLHIDSTRDFRDLGCHINVINNCQTLDKESRALGLSKEFKEGCLFMTYSTLIASSSRGKQTRLQQVVEWLGGPSFDGCLVFDECHKAKNHGKDGTGTKVAATVIELQKVLPQARVLYCSATGVSEVANMAYLSRMGLWGPSTAFRDFDAFLDTMKRRGVSFMEMLAMEMKMEGKYVARGLSFKETEFVELSIVLNEAQTEIYSAAVDVWQDVRRSTEVAIPMTGNSSGLLWRTFWSAQQRFFKLLCVSMKVPTVVAEAKEALQKGCSVVIGLQTTGEAATTSVGMEVGPVNDFVSPTREILRNYILNNFPVKYEDPKAEGAKGGIAQKQQQRPRLQTNQIYAGADSDDEGNGVMPIDFGPGGTTSLVVYNSPGAERDAVSAELLTMRAELLARVDDLQLPPNFLDELIDEFGGPDNVSEMTGRKSRTVRDSRGYLRHEMRAKPDSSEMDSLNVKEREKFQAGKCFIAIISDAASTGISLHASLSVANQRRRIHLTIELPWSADKAIQQLGRTHRSNQSSGPVYKLITTNVGGEKRFAAAVARRLQSLGALTRGDRRAASSVDLSTSNFDSALGRKSLRRMYDCLVLESRSLPPGVLLKDVYMDHKDTNLFDFSDDPQLQATAIMRLHQRLRKHCDTMGIGVGGSGEGLPGKADTVVEDKPMGKAEAKDQGDVRRFLNRLLGLHVDEQNLLFGYFFATLAAETQAAKSEGKLSEGLSDLRGRSVTLKGSKLLWRDKASGLTTTRNDFDIDRGVSFQEAVQMLGSDSMTGDESGFMISRKSLFGHRHVLLAVLKPGQRGVFTITKPNTGVSYFEMDRDDLYSRYERVPQDSPDLEMDWEATYERSLTQCMHGTECKMGMSCAAGRRITQATILSGSVVRIWGTLEQVLLRHELNLSKADRTMRVVRVELDAEGSHLVGVRFPMILLPEVVALLCAIDVQAKQEASLFPISSKDQNSNAVVVMGEEPPTPLDTKSMAKAFKAPKTLLDFFRPQGLTQKSNTTTARGAGVGGTPLQAAAGGNTALRRAAAAPPLSKAPQPPPRPGPSEEVFIDLDDEDDVDAIIAGGPALDEKADVDMGGAADVARKCAGAGGDVSGKDAGGDGAGKGAGGDGAGKGAADVARKCAGAGGDVSGKDAGGDGAGKGAGGDGKGTGGDGAGKGAGGDGAGKGAGGDGKGTGVDVVTGSKAVSCVNGASGGHAAVVAAIRKDAGVRANASRAVAGPGGSKSAAAAGAIGGQHVDRVSGAAAGAAGCAAGGGVPAGGVAGFAAAGGGVASGGGSGAAAAGGGAAPGGGAGCAGAGGGVASGAAAGATAAGGGSGGGAAAGGGAGGGSGATPVGVKRGSLLELAMARRNRNQVDGAGGSGDNAVAAAGSGAAADGDGRSCTDLQQLPSKRTKLADAPMDSYDIPAGSGADGGGGGRSCTDLQLLPSKRTKLDDTPKDSYGTPAAPPLNPRPKPAVSEPHKPRQNARPRTAVNATGSSEIQKADAANAKKEAGLELLIGMGFSREMSEKSLWLAHGNVSKAAAICAEKIML